MANEPFLEERLSECVRIGSGYQDDFEVEVVATADGQETRHLIHQFARRRFDIAYLDNREPFGEEVLSLYRRAYGRFAGFRFKSADDFTTNDDGTTAPAFDDQAMDATTDALVWQMQKLYDDGLAAAGVGLPPRTIFKPVDGTELIGIYNPKDDRVTSYTRANGYVLDDTTGLVTYQSDASLNISNIIGGTNTQVFTSGLHGLVAGNTVYFSGINGTLGNYMNSRRGQILSITGASSFIVDLNTGGQGAYAGGGLYNTIIQTDETGYAGTEFDLPMRFNSSLPVEYVTDVVRQTQNVELIEILNP